MSEFYDQTYSDNHNVFIAGLHTTHFVHIQSCIYHWGMGQMSVTGPITETNNPSVVDWHDMIITLPCCALNRKSEGLAYRKGPSGTCHYY